jgi:aspartate carbamoyltransferase catalytic subunit
VLLDQAPVLPREAFAGQHVLTMNQYSRTDLEQLFAVADQVTFDLAAGRLGRPLAGKVLLSAFFDRSTRTRLAHEVAMLRMGGSIAGFADAETTRAGGDTQESQADVFRMLGMYGDVVVTRLPGAGDAAQAAAVLDHGYLINGGDGTGEHPTQALTDLYTLRELYGGIDGLRLLLVNDLRMRCVRSLLRGLRHYSCEIHVVAGPGLDPRLRAECAEAGQVMIEHDSVAAVLPRVDAVYSSPTVSVSRDPAASQACALSRPILAAAGNPRLKVLHPLPRGAELSTDLDDTRHNAYWVQARNGVALRMALLGLMFNTI